LNSCANHQINSCDENWVVCRQGIEGIEHVEGVTVIGKDSKT
jgi:hypothetical protein